MRIGIICSTNFEKYSLIRELINLIASDIGKMNCQILSAAHSIGDQKVKKYALINEINYLEYNPAYTGHNMFSAEPKAYYEGKNWHYSQIIHRYNRLFLNVEKLFIFQIEKETDAHFLAATNKIPKKVKTKIII